MQTPGELQHLDHLAVVEFSGADAGRFLQGQLSNDVMALSDGGWQLTSLSNPKGRVVAVLRLTRLRDRFYGVLPDSLARTLLQRLAKYVLRSRVSLRMASPEFSACGTSGALEQWTIEPVAPVSSQVDAATAAQASRRAAIAAGHPQVYAATSEMFVAQMLNLDLVDGISFRKGCYTGQEIIARTQNLGRIKRRMLRFATNLPAPLAPGQTAIFDGFGAATVVEAAVTDAGDQEVLAVAHLEPATAGAGPEGDARIAVRELPLPYVIPERVHAHTPAPVTG
jgi:hypothetical protein